MPHPLFYTEVLVALRDSDDPAYPEAYQTLKEELSVDAILEAQFATLDAFKAHAKFFCDALKWTCMKGKSCMCPQ